MTKSTIRTKTRRSIVILLAVVLALIGAGVGYAYWGQKSGAATASAQDGYKTAQVRRGNLTLSASGSGTLVAGQKNQLELSNCR